VRRRSLGDRKRPSNELTVTHETGSDVDAGTETPQRRSSFQVNHCQCSHKERSIYSTLHLRSEELHIFRFCIKSRPG